MTYVQDYQYDIFVSYAHVDDVPLPGVQKGWVTTLIGCIKTRLAQRLGRSDAYSLWMDYELARHVNLTPQIMDALRHNRLTTPNSTHTWSEYQFDLGDACYEGVTEIYSVASAITACASCSAPICH